MALWVTEKRSLNPDLTSIEMDADTYCIYSQSLIPNTNADTPIPSLEVGEILVRLETNSTNNSTLWQSFDDCDGTRLEAYRAVAKSKSVAGKLEVMILLRNLV